MSFRDLEIRVSKFLDWEIKGWTYADWQDANSPKSFALDDIYDDLVKEFSDEDTDDLTRFYNEWVEAVNNLSEEDFKDCFGESLKESNDKEKTYVIFDESDGGTKPTGNSFNTEQEAVDFAKKNYKLWSVCRWDENARGYQVLKTNDPALQKHLKEAVEIHDQLNPKIWDDDKELRPEVRAKILQIVDKFQSQLLVDKVELKIEDIYILGSNANYNYTEESDLDVHIIADESFDCSAEHLPLLYNCYKALFNSKYDIRIKGINVELYVENKDKLSNVSAGLYSLKEGWIRNPAEYEIPEFDQLAVDREVQKWEDRYYEIAENPTIKKIDEYIDELYELRKDSIQNGEFAEGNLVFKEIRRRGYLDDLKELKIDLTSQELSLEALEESQTKLRYHYRGPVYHFNFCISEDWEAYTEAVSDKQALNNLTVKAKKDFDFVLQSRVTLNPDYLELVTGEEDIPDENFKATPKCEKCGHELTDAGECPICDLGDESAIREELEVFATYWTVTKNWLTMGGDMSDSKEYNFKTKEEAEEFKRRAEEKENASGRKGMDKRWFEGPEEHKIKVNFSSVDSALTEDANEKICESHGFATVWSEDGEFFANCGGAKELEANVEKAKRYAIRAAKKYHKAIKVLKNGCESQVIWRCDADGNELKEDKLQEALDKLTEEQKTNLKELLKDLS